MSSPTIKAGVFGKIPSHGDFVAMGTGSETGRSFEKFCQMANDQVAESGEPLPQGPIGFLFCDGDAASVLVGVLVRSRDSAGRKFPLSLFCECSITEGMAVAGAVGAFRSSIAAFGELAHETSEITIGDLKTKVAEAVPTPDPNAVVHTMAQEVARLADVPLRRILARVYGKDGARALGTQTLVRACDNARQRGAQRPPTLDLRATSDVELLFWLACAQSRLGPGVGVSCFWDTHASRALLCPGMPDSNTLCFLSRPSVRSNRLWDVTGGRVGSAEARAEQSLDPALVEMLARPGQTAASAFVDALASRGEG